MQHQERYKDMLVKAPELPLLSDVESTNNGLVESLRRAGASLRDGVMTIPATAKQPEASFTLTDLSTITRVLMTTARYTQEYGYDAARETVVNNAQLLARYTQAVGVCMNSQPTPWWMEVKHLLETQGMRDVLLLQAEHLIPAGIHMAQESYGNAVRTILNNKDTPDNTAIANGLNNAMTLVAKTLGQPAPTPVDAQATPLVMLHTCSDHVVRMMAAAKGREENKDAIRAAGIGWQRTQAAAAALAISAHPAMKDHADVAVPIFEAFISHAFGRPTGMPQDDRKAHVPTVVALRKMATELWNHVFSLHTQQSMSVSSAHVSRPVATPSVQVAQGFIIAPTGRSGSTTPPPVANNHAKPAQEKRPLDARFTRKR